MKKNIFILLFCFPYFIFAQEYSSSFDSIAKTDQTEYIARFQDQLNIKFDVSNDINNYYVPYDGTSANIVPNINVRYSLDFSYKFATIRLGIRSKSTDTSKENQGESDVFRMRAKFLFNNWAHVIEYNRVKGYYVKNTDEILNDKILGDRYIQFPNLKTNTLSGTSAYKFNPNYSVKATQSQTEIQLKSAGTFMPSIDYWFYQIEGLSTLKNTIGEIIQRENYNSYQGFNVILNAGYYYTFVYKKRWYANIYAIPGVGMDFYKETQNGVQSNKERNFNEVVLSFQTGAAIGYSSSRYFFGITGDNRTTNEKYSSEEIHFHASRNSFHIFFGYRFKAPKQITKPIDDIQNKVPILQEKN
jgi:hypothetical protein